MNENWFEKWVIIPLFPLYKTEKANNKVLKNIEKLTQQDKLDHTSPCAYMVNYTSLSVNEAIVFFDKTVNKKKSFEDKAKTNVIGVTIAVTLATGLYKVLVDVNATDCLLIYKLLLFLITLYVLFQMILAGLSSIKIVSDIIIVYEPYPEDTKLPEKELLDLIALDTEINVKYNTIRNNYLSSSYESIKKSLIGLLVLFILITFPINVFKINKPSKDIEDRQNALEQRIETIVESQKAQDSRNYEKYLQYEHQFNVHDRDIAELKNSVPDS